MTSCSLHDCSIYPRLLNNEMKKGSLNSWMYDPMGNTEMVGSCKF